MKQMWHRHAYRTAAIAIAVALQSAPLHAQSAPSDASARLQADRMAADLVARMTPDEKFDQLLNAAPAIARLGVPEYNWWTESLHGALGTLPTTNFPEPVGLAASFDDTLVNEVAGQISVELRALHVLARKTGRMDRIGTGLDAWSPNINIFRDPRWGRGQETYGEDPFLTAHMGVAFITGLQGANPDLPDIVATPKHFAVHSGSESTRHTANVFVSTHDLEDTYLPAFRAAIVEGHAGSIMCAYNRIDGQPACGSDLLLKERLRGAWGFKGYVVSDCDAVKDIADSHKYAPDQAAAIAVAMHAGVDNECHTGTIINIPGLGQRYREALQRGLISQQDIDAALIRLFSARYRVGDLAGLRAMLDLPTSAINTASAQALALKAAERSLVLLKNDGTLPLKPGVKLAVIGPLANATRVLRGNYSSSLSNTPVAVTQGLHAAFPQADVTLVPFGESFTDGDRIPTSALRTPSGKPGLLARYYNPAQPEPQAPGADGVPEFLKPMAVLPAPALLRIEPDVAGRSLDSAAVSNYHKVVWTGFIVPPATGTYRLGLSGFSGSMTFEGKPWVNLGAGFGALPTLKTVSLVAGHKYAIEVTAQSLKMSGVDLVWKHVVDDADAQLTAAAAKADVIVAVVGLTSDMEAEESSAVVPGFKGGDKTTLDLPADQIAMLEQAHKTGKPLVVVAMNGSPVNLSWAKDNASAILEAWYPGQAGGTAIANVLSGKVDPSGRLPLTFYRSVADLPAFDNYAMEGRTYRYFAGKPVYPFGYGLSYTQFAYQPLGVTTTQDGVTVKAQVRNSGKRAGAEVVQLYLNFPAVQGVPRVALRGFRRIELQPGESKDVTFDLSARDLSAVSPDGQRQVFAGHYRVSVGSGQPETGVPGTSGAFDIAKGMLLPE